MEGEQEQGGREGEGSDERGDKDERAGKGSEEGGKEKEEEEKGLESKEGECEGVDRWRGGDEEVEEESE